MESPADCAQTSPFFTLPAELRNMVYKHLVVDVLDREGPEEVRTTCCKPKYPPKRTRYHGYNEVCSLFRTEFIAEYLMIKEVTVASEDSAKYLESCYSFKEFEMPGKLKIVFNEQTFDLVPILRNCYKLSKLNLEFCPHEKYMSLNFRGRHWSRLLNFAANNRGNWIKAIEEGLKHAYVIGDRYLGLHLVYGRDDSRRMAALAIRHCGNDVLRLTSFPANTRVTIEGRECPFNVAPSYRDFF